MADPLSVMAYLTAQAQAAGSSDGLAVGVHVGGRDLGRSRLTEWRWEGRVNPEGYLGENGLLQVLASPWTETASDAWAALKMFRVNRSRSRRIVRSKQHRFRVGRAWTEPSGWAAGRVTALNASIWLDALRIAGVDLSGSFINIGANDGRSDDPLHDIAVDWHRKGTSGPSLAVEADPALCKKHQANLPWVPLACQLISPQNAAQIVRPAFPSPQARRGLDVLKVDIDSFEGFLVEECLWRIGLEPKILLVEVNAAIPPPLEYALLDSPQLRRNYPEVELSVEAGDVQHSFEVNKPIAGVSLSWLVRRLAPRYRLLELGSPDAIFARSDIMERLGREPLDEFRAFEFGWVDVHGFSRHQVRRWFYELDEVAALGELHDYLVQWMRTHLGVVLPFSLGY